MNIFDDVYKNGCPNCGGLDSFSSYISAGYAHPAFEEDRHKGNSFVSQQHGISCHACGWGQDVELQITTKPGRKVPRWLNNVSKRLDAIAKKMRERGMYIIGMDLAKGKDETFVTVVQMDGILNDPQVKQYVRDFGEAYVQIKSRNDWKLLDPTKVILKHVNLDRDNPFKPGASNDN